MGQTYKRMQPFLVEIGADEGFRNKGSYIRAVFKAFSKSQLVEIVKLSVGKLEPPECGDNLQRLRKMYDQENGLIANYGQDWGNLES